MRSLRLSNRYWNQIRTVLAGCIGRDVFVSTRVDYAADTTHENIDSALGQFDENLREAYREFSRRQGQYVKVQDQASGLYLWMGRQGQFRLDEDGEPSVSVEDAVTEEGPYLEEYGPPTPQRCTYVFEYEEAMEHKRQSLHARKTEVDLFLVPESAWWADGAVRLDRAEDLEEPPPPYVPNIHRFLRRVLVDAKDAGADNQAKLIEADPEPEEPEGTVADYLPDDYYDGEGEDEAEEGSEDEAEPAPETHSG